jgi:hypothetical protein
LRIAAGICVLSTGLLLGSGGGAIAIADHTDGAGGATTGTQGAGGQGSQGAGTTGTENKPETGATTTMGADDEPTDRPTPTSTVDAQTNGNDDEEESTGSTGTYSTGDESESTAPTSESAAPTSESNAPASQSNEPLSNVPPADSSAPIPESTPPTTPAAPPPPTVSKVVVEPMTNAFVTVARALGSGAATFAALPNSETPVADVIASMQEMLSSVAGAGAALAQVSNDIYTLLGVSQDAQPSLIGAGGALTAAAPVAPDDAPLFGPLTTQLPQLPPTGGDAPLFGTVVHASTVGGVAATGLSHQLTLSGLAPLAPAGLNGGAGSFFDHVVSAVLVPASLTALAAIALPGVGALLIVIGAGMRFGYRQAKAAFIMRTSGIARFAGPGPLGVVRSGSLIAMHTRTKADRSRPAHGAHRKQAHSTRHLERVA